MCATTDHAEIALPLTSRAPGTARAFAVASGCSEHDTHVVDDALLLVSELVTNAVRYGAPPVLVAVECQGDAVRIRVRDSAPGLPRQRRAHEDAETGRGLELLESLSDTWGVERVADEHGTGKSVWFELRLPAAV